MVKCGVTLSGAAFGGVTWRRVTLLSAAWPNVAQHGMTRCWLGEDCGAVWVVVARGGAGWPGLLPGVAQCGAGWRGLARGGAGAPW